MSLHYYRPTLYCEGSRAHSDRWDEVNCSDCLRSYPAREPARWVASLCGVVGAAGVVLGTWLIFLCGWSARGL
jgi:hypothetical protein